MPSSKEKEERKKWYQETGVIVSIAVIGILVVGTVVYIILLVGKMNKMDDQIQFMKKMDRLYRKDIDRLKPTTSDLKRINNYFNNHQVLL
jgi:hypothetical protein